MTTHTTTSREQWLAARLELLEAEKELTRRSDAVARQRQQLPWVPVEKDYRFETEAGAASLADLFGGRSQLLVYHFMFGPEYSGGCPSCSAIADGFNGFAVHLENHDVGAGRGVTRPDRRAAGLQATDGLDDSRGPLRWTATSTLNSARRSPRRISARGAIDYNYRPMDTTWIPGGLAAQHAAMCGTDTATYIREQPGMSAFAIEDGVVYHTYSTYSRGLDGLWGMYQWLDRAPKGRNEHGAWFRRRDEY